MTAFKLYNSLQRKKEDFVPIDPEHVRIYACGPTVYNYAHIGNARMAVVFDLLTRVLREHYPKVTYVSNITDIDDKIIKAANDSGEEIKTITEKFARIYNEDMASLGVSVPDQQPKATEHMGEMIAMIQALIEKGHAYEAEGHVLFHVPSFPNYGCLSGRDREQQLAGSRVEVAPYKKDPGDFVLWKPSTADQPGWDSDWGRGRPGWHIECSAMAEKTLGVPFDIHVGGMDLTFPHHENEIAQSVCAHGHEDAPESFVRYWMHNGFVTISDEKMSKSLGNIQLVHDLIKDFPGETLRLALLSSHYRQPLNWNRELIQQSQKTLERLYRLLKENKDVPEDDAQIKKVPEEIMAALSDDLNTAKAMAALNGIAKALSAAKDDDRSGLKTRLLAGARLLGILQEDPDQFLGYERSAAGDGNAAVDEKTILALIAERKEARESRDFATADRIRDDLKSMKIEIEDTPDGTEWRVLS